MAVRIPVALIRTAYENGTLSSLVGEEEAVAQAMGVIMAGDIGEIIHVDSGDSNVVIKVEDYEG